MPKFWALVVAWLAVLMALIVVVDALNLAGPTWAWQLGFAAAAAAGGGAIGYGANRRDS